MYARKLPKDAPAPGKNSSDKADYTAAQHSPEARLENLFKRDGYFLSLTPILESRPVTYKNENL